MYKAIIIDDISLVRDAIRLLAQWDVFGIDQIFEADNAQDGLEIILKEQPQIILTDMKIPVMDGTQLLEKLEEFHIKSKIIVISGFSDYKYTRLAIKSGAIDYILKPIDPQDLNNALATAVSQLELESKNSEIPATQEAEAVEPVITNQVVNEMITYINAHYLNNISLTDIAETFFLNKEHLSRLFKKNRSEFIYIYHASETDRSQKAPADNGYDPR